ncbi:MAG: bifunctional class I SAM-dependent methyltransferase/glycosyltransferase family 2 protein [Planctomycetaceae bacterium]|nr:bifunctional class I SAM-dependent methyltransferase/glycosyltransferase family 2 protein [Planctomycetaceae bacterium]
MTAAQTIHRADDAAREAYLRQRREHWDKCSSRLDWRVRPNNYYYQRLGKLFRYLIPPGLRVLEIGCGQGDLLAAVVPAAGVGVDFSQAMIDRARQRHPELQLICAEAEEFKVEGPFDAIILSDLFNDLWDVQKVLRKVAGLCHSRTLVVMNVYSQLWEFPRKCAELVHLATPKLPQNWLAPEDVLNLLELEGFQSIRNWQEFLWPIRTPLLNAFFDRFLVRLWPFRLTALTNFAVARLRPNLPSPEAPQMQVSVVVPARNEAGNIEAIFQRTPEMGGGTELIFVEGGSKDGTYEAVEKAIAAHPERRAALYRQSGKGKGDAVRLGFAKATGEVLMILDADLTVAPEDLPRFYEALRDGRGEFINGVRLVYPMEKRAMRLINLVGNKFFSLAFSWIIGQSIKDTLCGTKVLTKANYERIAANRAYFGDFDPFGDFDLIFGAAKLNLKLVDVPIRYRERTYGETNIQRWRHGWLLIKMVAFSLLRMKFI